MSLQSFRVAALVAGASTLIFAFGGPSGAADAARNARPFGVLRAHPAPVARPRGTRRRNNAAGCSSNYSGSNGATFFVGLSSPMEPGSGGTPDIAGGENSAVLGGGFNSACDRDSAIGAGALNEVGGGGTSGASFIGAGSQNQIIGLESMIGSGSFNKVSALDAFIGAGASNAAAGAYSFVGAGEENSASGAGAFVGGGGSQAGLNAVSSAGGNDSFIGAGDANAIAGNGSFIGAGDTEYVSQVCGSTCAAGNQIAAADAFVGAGDLNVIANGGDGSFIGGGGVVWAGGAHSTAGNQIAGQDSFIGAGDQNTLNATESAIGAGANNFVNGTYAFVGSGTYNTAGYYSSVVGGGGNTASGGYSFVGGGGDSHGNQVSGTGAFVGAGDANNVSGAQGFVGAGSSNKVSATAGFIGAGTANTIASGGNYASVIGGLGNTASGTYASVIGGYKSVASGAYAIVAGGNSSTASGTLTYAAGYHADAVNSGSFVWSDYKSGSALVKDTAANQFIVRASGGTKVYSNEATTSGVTLAAGSGTWASLSDRNAKTAIVPLDDAAILAKVSTLPVSAWQYTSETGVRHIGPMAQDFYAAFRVGPDDRHITSIDEDGVALAAVKAVNAKLDRENARLHSDLSRLHAENELVKSRLAELEMKVDSLASARNP